MNRSERQSGVPMKTLWHEGGSEECWPWLGCKAGNTEYGKKTFFKRTILAHRWMYEQRVGPIPDGMVIDHLCGNRSCVNPAHLEVVTQTENCRRGRNATLTEREVAEIRAAYPVRKWGDGAALARKYGVTTSTIHDVWNLRSWKDVEAA